MYKIIFAQKDTAIYEVKPTLNAGLDEVLEITKLVSGQQMERSDPTDMIVMSNNNYNSRILIKFDLSNLDSGLVDKIDNDKCKCFLNLKIHDATSLNTDYSICAYPIAEYWNNGRGYYNDSPTCTDGASWYYLDDSKTKTQWNSSSFDFEFSAISGGGSWHSNYEASQSFEMTNADIRMDVTNIIKAHLDNIIPNHGIILKYPTEIETNETVYGSLKFFSRETHTVYPPRLEVFWDDQNEYSGSFMNNSLIQNSDFSISYFNIKSIFKVGEQYKLNIFVKYKHRKPTYYNEIITRQSLRLPDTSYISITDYVTGEIIVPYSEVGTKICTNNDGQYFNLNFDNFMPERIYKLLIKVVNGIHTEIINDNIYFKVEQ